MHYLLSYAETFNHKKANDNNVLFQVMSISFIFINIKCQLLRPYMNPVLGVTDQVRQAKNSWILDLLFFCFVLFCFVFVLILYCLGAVVQLICDFIF